MLKNYKKIWKIYLGFYKNLIILSEYNLEPEKLDDLTKNRNYISTEFYSKMNSLLQYKNEI